MTYSEILTEREMLLEAIGLSDTHYNPITNQRSKCKAKVCCPFTHYESQTKIYSKFLQKVLPEGAPAPEASKRRATVGTFLSRKPKIEGISERIVLNSGGTGLSAIVLDSGSGVVTAYGAAFIGNTGEPYLRGLRFIYENGSWVLSKHKADPARRGARV